MKNRLVRILFPTLLLCLSSVYVFASGDSAAAATPFPLPLESYNDAGVTSLWDKLVHRVQVAPFNLIASVLFLLAILHTFVAGYFREWAHAAEVRHKKRLEKAGKSTGVDGKEQVSFVATILHLLGEVEAVFGAWCIPLLVGLSLFYGWDAVTGYIDRGVSFVEPLFVIVIMSVAGTRPVVKLAESCLKVAAQVGKSTPAAWWFSILTVGPLLASLITEPAAMTIAALLLGRQFYELEPSSRLKYATIGLLFVNVSVGGVLTHFAAPPVIMVASVWKLTTPFMATHFGYKAFAGIIVSNVIYWIVFRKEFAALKEKAQSPGRHGGDAQQDPSVPAWISAVHVFFLGWTVLNLHHPALFLGGFLFFLAFTTATSHHQYDLQIRGPLLVGFFLSGLVVFGGMQNWWLQPVLTSLGEFALYMGATILTSFNDNAAITYLCSQVPEFMTNQSLQNAVIAGAVTGGGLTVIANAPNPAGQSILQRYFSNGVSPLWLAVGALTPTLVMIAAFRLLPNVG